MAQEHRRAVFPLLVQQGPEGFTAGEIAERVEGPASGLSLHLAHLERVHMLRSWRVRRNGLFAVSAEGWRRLLGFLIDEYCQEHREIC